MPGDASRVLATDECWNHNTHYHRLLPAVARPPFGRVLDVGCGEGLLTRRLAPFADEVVGLDLSPAMVDQARAATGPGSPRYVCGDVLTAVLDGQFDLVTCFATLHHMDLDAGLSRLRELTAPGGSLVVVGLARAVTPWQLLASVAAVPASWLARRRRGDWDPGAPVTNPTHSYTQVRRAAARHLPGARFRLRLYWRYSLVWRAPGVVSPAR